MQRETHLGCGRPLESILRHLQLCRPAVLPVVAGVLRLPGSLPLLRLLCRGVFGFVISLFRPCRRLGRSAPGEELVAAGGAIWTDLQRGSSRVTRPEVAFGVRDLRPAQVGGSCRCRSIGEAF